MGPSCFWRSAASAILAIACAGRAGFAADKALDISERLNASADTLADVTRTADKGIPRMLLDQARCVIVVPGIKKALLLFGAKDGRGFAVCRRRDGMGWSAPAAMKMEGGKRQLGASETDMVLLAMSDSGVKHLLADRFTISGAAAPRMGRNVVCGGVVTTRSRCAAATAGPVGHDLAAGTDATKNAEILCWSRSRGMLEGVVPEGATLRADAETNLELYGGDQSNREILTGDMKAPAAAEKFQRVLSQTAKQSR